MDYKKLQRDAKKFPIKREDMVMTNNSIILMNDIILRIYNTSDFNEMRKTLISSLRFLVPSFGISFYLATPNQPYHLSNGIGIGISEKCMQIYLDEYQEYDQTTWSYGIPVSKAYIESAFLQTEREQNTDFYRRVYAPEKLMYQISLTLIHNGVFLGVIAMFRTKEEGDYKQDELFALEMIASHLSIRLYHHSLTIGECRAHHPDREVLLNQYQLTLREIEILYAILDEDEKNSICQRLCISPNTLKKHVMNLYKKFHVNTLVGLYQVASKL